MENPLMCRAAWRITKVYSDLLSYYVRKFRTWSMVMEASATDLPWSMEAAGSSVASSS